MLSQNTASTSLAEKGSSANGDATTAGADSDCFVEEFSSGSETLELGPRLPKRARYEDYFQDAQPRESQPPSDLESNGVPSDKEDDDDDDEDWNAPKNMYYFIV